MQRKVFLLSGVAFVALALATVVGIGGSTPGSDASGAKLAAFYGDHAVRHGDRLVRSRPGRAIRGLVRRRPRDGAADDSSWAITGLVNSSARVLSPPPPS